MPSIGSHKDSCSRHKWHALFLMPYTTRRRSSTGNGRISISNMLPSFTSVRKQKVHQGIPGKHIGKTAGPLLSLQHDITPFLPLSSHRYHWARADAMTKGTCGNSFMQDCFRDAGMPRIPFPRLPKESNRRLQGRSLVEACAVSLWDAAMFPTGVSAGC